MLKKKYTHMKMRTRQCLFNPEIDVTVPETQWTSMATASIEQTRLSEHFVCVIPTKTGDKLARNYTAMIQVDDREVINGIIKKGRGSRNSILKKVPGCICSFVMKNTAFQAPF